MLGLHKGRRPNRDPAALRRSWRHKRLAASISAQVEAAVLDISVALNASLPDPTDSTTTTESESTTTTSGSQTETITTTTTTTTETTTTTTTTTSISTSTSTSLSTSSRTRTITHDHTTSHTTTSTRFTTSTTFKTNTSLTTSTSSTLYTQITTLFTTSSSSPTLDTSLDTSSTSLSVNIPATTGVLGSGDDNSKGFAHDTGAIVGVSVGILVFVLFAGILLFFGIKRYRRGYSSSSASPVRPPIDGEDDVLEVALPSSPVDQDQAQLSPPLVATTSLGHGSSSGEDSDNVMAPGSVDIHGASVESGGTLYPSSQGHSTSSGDHLLGGGSPVNASGFAPFALSPSSSRPPTAWRSGASDPNRASSPQSQHSYPYSMAPPPASSPTTSSSGHGHSSLLPSIPPISVPVAKRPASSKSSKRRSLLERVFGSTNKRSSASSSVASDTPRASISRTYSPPPPQMTELLYGDSAPWRKPPASFLASDPTAPGAGAGSLSLPPTLRERNLSAPEGLLHPKRPDLITLESSRTLMDHVDYSRPILPISVSSFSRLRCVLTFVGRSLIHTIGHIVPLIQPHQIPSRHKSEPQTRRVLIRRTFLPNT